MNSIIRKIIKEVIEESFLICEVKIDIDDTQKRGFADQLGQMYKESLKELKPVKIYGKLNVSIPGSNNASIFVITLSNGDIIKAIRNTNPAYGQVFVNDEKNEYFINSQELFNNKFPDIIKKYYLEYKTAKAGIPSI